MESIRETKTNLCGSKENLRNGKLIILISTVQKFEAPGKN